MLDDNKMLCLANGERIKLPSTMHIMFEVQDLAVASPATVSRCGMVYMEQVHVGLDPLITTWSQGHVEDLLPEQVPRLLEMIRSHVPKVVKWIRANASEVIKSTNQNLLQSFLHLLTTLLTPQYGVRGTGMKAVPRTAAEKRAEEVRVAFFSLLACVTAYGSLRLSCVRMSGWCFSCECV